MQHSEVGHADGQVLVRPGRLVEHQAVARAVHRLQPEVLLLDLELEHAVGVVVPVARGVPQLGVVDVGADHLLEPSLPVLLLQEGEELVVNVSSLGWKKQDPRDNSWKKKRSC